MSAGPLLIVDDDPHNLAVLRQILGTRYRLVFARDGAGALAAAARHAPALVLLDIAMPDMDGYAVCRALKADPRSENIPVIFVTALGEVGDEARGFAAGGVDYLVKPVSPPIVQARVATHLSLVRAARLEQSYRDAVFMLGEAGHYNDAETGEHIWRMAAYARALAEAAGWGEETCQLIELAAPMHDTGKLGIPDTLLRKPGRLDPAEWAVMKTHTRIGHEILAKSDAPVFRLAAEVALRHHEWWNGEGYPDGLAGEAIPEAARIVALADVFDALTMKRPYKEAWPVARAMAQVQASAGQQFEPRLVELFVDILPRILQLREGWSGAERAPEDE
jgi:putative two-component system response regulator